MVALSVLVAGCSTTQGPSTTPVASETVMISYHVKQGKELEFQALLTHAWQVYRGERLVCAEPHTVVRDTEGNDKARFVEIFTWVKSPDHAPDSVQQVWKREQSLCEARAGHQGIEGGEVQLVTGR